MREPIKGDTVDITTDDGRIYGWIVAVYDYCVTVQITRSDNIKEIETYMVIDKEDLQL